MLNLHTQMEKISFLRLSDKIGEMLEWLKRHAWKACGRQKRLASSNLALSANKDGAAVKLRCFFDARPVESLLS